MTRSCTLFTASNKLSLYPASICISKRSRHGIVSATKNLMKTLRIQLWQVCPKRHLGTGIEDQHFVGMILGDEKTMCLFSVDLLREQMFKCAQNRRVTLRWWHCYNTSTTKGINTSYIIILLYKLYTSIRSNPSCLFVVTCAWDQPQVEFTTGHDRIHVSRIPNNLGDRSSKETNICCKYQALFKPNGNCILSMGYMSCVLWSSRLIKWSIGNHSSIHYRLKETKQPLW